MRPIRRSRSAGALLAVGLLFATSACGADSPDPQQSEPTTDAVDDVDEPSTTPAPTTPAPTTSAPATTDAPEPASTAPTTPVDIDPPFEPMSAAYGSARWLVPWDDGFLAVGVRHQPPLLPEQLPPDIAELFPPEVVELFPDGLPPTQAAAIEILRKAGLLDVVTGILEEHPEAMDALNSVPPADTELTASWTAAGDTWIPTDLSLPENLGEVSQLTVAGDRLTLAGTVRPAAPGDPWIVSIASTTDLLNWDTASLPISLAEGLEQAWVTPSAVAADDEHWVASIWPAAELLPPSENELWTAAWGAEPVMVGASETTTMLMATSEGFVEVGDGISFSPDGQTWTEVAQTWTEAAEPAPNVLIHATAPMGDNVLAVRATPDGDSSVLVLDATGNATNAVEFPELSDAFSWTSMSSPAFVVGAATPDTPEQMPDVWLLATDDGETWMLEPLDDVVIDMWGPPALVATNGTDVLVRTNDTGWGAELWQRFAMAP